MTVRTTMAARKTRTRMLTVLTLALLSLVFGVRSAGAATTHVYYSDTSAISSLDLLTLTSQTVLPLGSGVQPLEMRTDQANGHVYFHSGTAVSATIQRMDLDGTNLTLIYQGGSDHSILNLALDTVNQQLYDSEPELDRITRVNTDGTGITSFVNTSNANGLEVDPAGGKFYYTERFGNVIRRVNLNGTGMQNVITPSTDPTVVQPWTIDLDVAAGKLYFAGYDTSSGVVYKIQRSNLDGTGFEDLLTLGGVPRALRVDEQAGLMYWAEGSSLRRANLDGTGATTLLTHPSNIYGVTLVTVPEPSTLLQLGLGAILMVLAIRRKR